MMDVLITTALIGIAMLWFSTKTSNIAFQKLFAALGILLFALTFLQVAVIAGASDVTTTNTSRLLNSTADSSTVNKTTTTYVYESVNITETLALGGAAVVSQGNLALFTVFGFVLFMSLIWFAIDYIGIGMNDLGQITKRRRG
jgi:hypothetical protein